jgi:uncharacterized protein YozE (UPF0346 family)
VIRYSNSKIFLEIYSIERRYNMRKSFYHFLMKYRHPEPKDEISVFANNAYHDHSFPKISEDYDEISSYLELNGQYLESMSVFDEAWEQYLFTEKNDQDR